MLRKMLDGPSESENRPRSGVCKEMREQEGVLSKKTGRRDRRRQSSRTGTAAPGFVSKSRAD